MKAAARRPTAGALGAQPSGDAAAPGIRTETAARVRWAPRQHGAWAMLAIPFLLGVIVSRPSPWQAVLLATAVVGYLASAAGLEWVRARREPYLRRAALLSALFAVGAIALLVAFPQLLATLVVLAPAGAVAAWVTVRARPRSLAASLAQVTQALVLVPAASVISGTVDPPAVARATLVAALYLVGSVLVVRSMIRERGNERFLAASIGYHAAAVTVAAWLLPLAYAALALGFTVRAAGLPLLQQRLTDGKHRLRPIHLGLVEIVCAAAIVLTALVVRF